MDEIKKLRRDFGPGPATDTRDASRADPAGGPWAPVGDGPASPTAMSHEPAGDAARDEPRMSPASEDSQPTSH
jgi:hypothetical protein